MQEKFKILEDNRHADNWITGIYYGKRGERWFQAKVYNETSTYGVNDCRVSKLAISKANVTSRIGNEPFFDLVSYNYDRGLDFNRLNQSQYILQDILDYLNNLPAA